MDGIKYISYKVVGDIFTYNENVDGVIVIKEIPLYVDGAINPQALEIVDSIQKVKKELLSKNNFEITPLFNNFKELYASIKNPLDDRENIDKFIDGYTDILKVGGFYNAITHYNSMLKDDIGKIIPSSKDKFYSYLFNMWKNSIIRLKLEGKIDKESKYLDIYDTIKDIKDITTYDELEKYLSNDVISESYFGSLSNYSTWFHIMSHVVRPGYGKKISKVKHRLYVNVSSIIIYDLLNEFVSICDYKNIPYYFKFEETCSRDDSLVFYVDTYYLLHTINIINTIIERHDNFKKYIYEPSIIAGKLNDFIGYGCEPIAEESSYSESRANLIENAFDKTIDEYIKNNQKITVYGVKMLDILSQIGTDNLFNYYKGIYEIYKRKNQLEYLYDSYGLIEQDFTRQNFKNTIYLKIRSNMSKMINEVDFFVDAYEEITIKVRNNKTIKLTKDDFRKIKKSITRTLFSNDTSLYSILRKNIDEASVKVGIDEAKFVINNKMLQEMESVDILKNTINI